MKIISLLILLSVSLINLSFGQNEIESALQQFTQDPELRHASISFKAIDLTTNNSIAESNADLTLPTASTAKLFSTATALEILGPDYQAETQLYYKGVIDSIGTLHGNLWIRGGGDPSFGSKYFNDEIDKKNIFDSWVTALNEAGIKKINGNVIADASAFGYQSTPDGWNWVDLGNYYGAGPSGSTIYDNLLEYHFKTNPTAGQATTITELHPSIPDLKVHNYVLSSNKRGDNAYIYGAPYSLDRFVTGELPVNKNDFVVKGSIPDPEYLFAIELSETIKNKGIPIEGKAIGVRNMDLASKIPYNEMELIHTHKGEKLIDIINLTNLKSINLFAEHLINLIGFVKTGDGSTESGLKILMTYWNNKTSLDGIHLNDGSGLSRTNAISANNYIALLSSMNNSKNAKSFHASLPIAGVSGTLKGVCKSGYAKNRLSAKSGTMNRIKSYAGYINSSSGKKIAFAIIVNNHSCSSRALARKMENIFNRLAVY